MNEIIYLKIIGKPVAKGRPKVAVRGKFPTIYTPKKTKDAEENIINQVKNEIPETPLEGPIKVTINFHMPRPKSLKKNIVHHTKKPDIDNLAKLLIDSLNKKFYYDDSQIIELVCKKFYSENPLTEVIIEKYK